MRRAAVALVILQSAVIHGADPGIPHIHQGSIDPFKPGPPPPLSSSEIATLNAGKTVQNTVKQDGGAGRAMAVFDVPAPPSLVWDCILDLKNYPRMVPGVSAMELYYGPSTSGGVTSTKAKWTLSMIGYRLSYYLITKYEPKHNSMTFRLDYSRNSDLDDSVGYWHVAPLPREDGSTHSRVTYMAALALRGWFPKSVIDFLFATTLGKATEWVGTEAAKRMSAGGGAAKKSYAGGCRWSWKRMRNVCPPPPPPPPPSGPSPLRDTLDMAATTLSIVTGLMLIERLFA
eukprot:CAMPEP_0115851228 /NCGR_PEP_ID=MMETSP0287-20121206/12374_1 /TAXON_ID=412157 /ORGANISM="Chrysochromulina rotalis, Strain UIO044" /LENGTH=286 /DNA_ID=CAMNT_0003305255 /DNA_START=132 /DNA_END=992 /DNA_ORIENTATION=+